MSKMEKILVAKKGTKTIVGREWGEHCDTSSLQLTNVSVKVTKSKTTKNSVERLSNIILIFQNCSEETGRNKITKSKKVGT